MRPDLDEALCADFPCLFRLRHERRPLRDKVEVRPLGKTPFDVALSEVLTEYDDVFEALADPREPICHGFEIEDGWEPIVRRLAEKLEPIARQTPELVCVQVKEKNGGLRFYVEHGALPDVIAKVRTAIAEAREQSTRTCEQCGADGVLRGAHYVQTLCALCADHLAERRSRK